MEISGYTHLVGFNEVETPKAMLFCIKQFNGVEVPFEFKKWIPLSQIHKTNLQPKSSQEPDEIWIADWLGKKIDEEISEQE